MSDWEGTMGRISARSLFALAMRSSALAAALVALVGLAAAPANADERVLDARLSLIGGCAKPEALDPVEDPGCPTTPPASAHPPAAFAVPAAISTDFYGNVYVTSFGKALDGSQSRIDIFDPEGVFISELKTPGASSTAIDSKGNLYVATELESTRSIRRFTADAPYEPETGGIAYTTAPVSLTLAGPGCPVPLCAFRPDAQYLGLAIDVENDHLFANFAAAGLAEYGSADEGNAELRSTLLPTFAYGVGVAVDAARDKLYASIEDKRVAVFDLSEPEGSPPAGYKQVGLIDGSEVPAGEFGGYLSLAVDEATGHLFVLDGDSNVVYEFDEDGSYVATIEHSLLVPPAAELGVDNGPFSPHGALSGNGRYLYVPSGKTGTGHSYAFEESSTRAPEVKSTGVSGITESEAELEAAVNSGNLETDYTFEYTTGERFIEEGFTGATVAGSGQLPPGNLDDEAFAPATGLLAGTQYRFRIVATNEKGADEMEGEFGTYPTYPSNAVPCGNQLLRTGFSAIIPDCRAYELVTPADTNGRAPLGVGHEGGNFTSFQASPAGDKVPFRVEGGTLPGTGGTGSYLGDPFVSSRGPGGWSTAFIGPSAAEAVAITPGWTSPDQGFSFWTAENKGSALIEGKSTSYLRYPDGHSEVLGEGSIGRDLGAVGLLISDGGDHVLFGTGAGSSETTAVQIEPEAPPNGTRAIYDRTADGVVHVVSLLPGDVPFAAGERAFYLGNSLDGKGVAFEAGPLGSRTLYLRYQNEETFDIGEGVVFAGVAEGGSRIFYLEGGKLWRFDAATGDKTAFSSGAVTPVNISADGSAAYFVSTGKLTTEANPNGAFAKAGKQNLYRSEEGTIAFVGTVTERDVAGFVNGKSEKVDGLGLWAEASSAPTSGRFAIDPSRTTPDGRTMLFQSRAPLAGYDPEGHAEVYRYDSTEGRLHCLSCNPTGAAATGDATLQSEGREGFALYFPQAWIQNLRSDGRRAIFQSMEALVPGDTDARQDVYEWEDQGVGSCATAGGCLFLVSSGHSLRNDYVWAVSESGNDVFILSSDLLLPTDQDETPSIYDARVGGGFPEPAKAECEGEGCRPQLAPAPALPDAQTPVHGAGDNVKSHPCGKGKRKVKRGGKTRCVKKHKKHGRGRAGSNRRGGSR